jgi:coenzyme Q-binding protein COQ10
VSDVARYQEFVPSCQSSLIVTKKQPIQTYGRSEQRSECEAELIVGFGQFRERYQSHVVTWEHYRNIRDQYRVTASASNSTLFHLLETEWLIQPHGRNGCEVKFHVKFQFKSAIHAQMSDLVFDQVSRGMMEAFERRAGELAVKLPKKM